MTTKLFANRRFPISLLLLVITLPVTVWGQPSTVKHACFLYNHNGSSVVVSQWNSQALNQFTSDWQISESGRHYGTFPPRQVVCDLPGICSWRSLRSVCGTGDKGGLL